MQIGKRGFEIRPREAAGGPAQGQGAYRRIGAGVDHLFEIDIQVLDGIVLGSRTGDQRAVGGIRLFEAVESGHVLFDGEILFPKHGDQLFQLAAGFGAADRIEVVLFTQIDADPHLGGIVYQGHCDDIVAKDYLEDLLCFCCARQVEATVANRQFGRIEDQRGLIFSICHFFQIDLRYRSRDSR